MAKVQKTFYVNDSLARFLDAHQASTGVSFTRIMNAALIQYFFLDPDSPDPEWMERAIALERGEITIGDLPERLMKEAMERHKAIRAGYPKLKYEDWDPQHQAEFTQLPNVWSDWKKIVDREGEDRVQAIIDFRNDRRRGKI
ncbi:MAG: hypothetical protein KJ749_11790 [Planctomycetes bacterium]|nr:hypothetical protein [Planctomycetota bacterium]